MADSKILAPLILKWEAGYSSNTKDKGNYDNKENLIGSNKGITPSTFYMAFGHYPTIDEMKGLTSEQFNIVFKRLFWDKYQADKINNQSIANILVDWFWGSGYWGIKIPQKILGLLSDGVVGVATLTKINNVEQKKFFDQVKQARIDFVNNIVKNDLEQQIFLKGWLRRIDSYIFIA